MKEATGELNMTVVTLIAVAAVGAIFYFAVWPIIQKSIVNQTCETYGTGWHAEKVDQTTVQNGSSSAKVYKWACCPSSATQYSATECKLTD